MWICKVWGGKSFPTLAWGMMGGKQVDIKIPLLGPENQSSPPFLGRATGPTCCIAGRWGAVSSDDDDDDDDLIFYRQETKKNRDFFYSVELISGNHGGQITCDDDDDDDDDDGGDARTMGMIMMVMTMTMMIMMIRGSWYLAATVAQLLPELRADSGHFRSSTNSRSANAMPCQKPHYLIVTSQLQRQRRTTQAALAATQLANNHIGSWLHIGQLRISLDIGTI